MENEPTLDPFGVFFSGKAVNNLRKDPDVGRRAKELVAKWKGCVNVAVTTGSNPATNAVNGSASSALTSMTTSALPPPVPAPPPEPPRPPPPPTDPAASVPTDMEISPGDSQEDDDDDGRNEEVNFDDFISAEMMERGEAAIRADGSKRGGDEEQARAKPTLDDRLKGTSLLILLLSITPNVMKRCKAFEAFLGDVAADAAGDMVVRNNIL